MYKRELNFAPAKKESCFLWGPRQTGKSTLLKSLFPRAPYYDLLLTSEFERLNREPDLFREECLALRPSGGPVIIDEVQRLPSLLNEVQWLMVNHGTRFILSGSSARKLKRSGGNLLGGRALRFELFPLVSHEIPNFNLLRALNHGLLPRHYLSPDPGPLVQAYVGNYLKEEVYAEALVRNMPAFHRFLEAAAFSNGELVNFNNIAMDCGVSGPAAKDYFGILEDTLIGKFIYSYRRRPKRRVIQAPKFYFFDVGVVNHLLRRGEIRPKSEAFGKAFEHFIYQELTAHSHYSGLGYAVTTWRTASQLEVDFVLGEADIAIEVKGTDMAGGRHAKGLKAFSEEYKTKRRILVSLDPRPRKMGGVEVLPWKDFLVQLWSGNLIR